MNRNRNRRDNEHNSKFHQPGTGGDAAPDHPDKEERLEEFRFLFERLPQAVGAAHPPHDVLVDYVRGLRPKGIDPHGWEAHAVSVHTALCERCRRELARVRRRERLWAFVLGPAQLARRLLGEERRRRAYQYMGLLLLIGGIFLVYSLWQGSVVEPPPPDQPPPPAYERGGDSPGVG